MQDQKKLFTAIRNGNEMAFEQLFHAQYEKLYRLCRRYIYEKEVAEELVQDVFIYIWQNRKSLVITSSLSSYLATAVKNRSLNYLKSKYAQQKALTIDDTFLDLMDGWDENREIHENLKEVLKKGIDSLPEKCRIIFNLSRNSGMTYNEIAEELSISKESVKSQIKIALQKLRIYLKEHLEFLFILFHTFF